MDIFHGKVLGIFFTSPQEVVTPLEAVRGGSVERRERVLSGRRSTAQQPPRASGSVAEFVRTQTGIYLRKRVPSNTPPPLYDPSGLRNTDDGVT